MSVDNANPDPARARLADVAARMVAAAQDFAAAVHGDLADALDLAEKLRRLTEAASGHVLNEIDREGLWALDGQRSFTTWAQARTGDARSAVKKRIHRAQHLRDHLPLTSRSFDHGRISAAHIDHIVAAATTSPGRLAALHDEHVGERWLVEHAQTKSADEFRRYTRPWAAAADPEAEDRAFREACARNELQVARTMGGYHLTGWFDDDYGHTLTTALEAATGVVPEGDSRTRGQRNADALNTIVRLNLDSGALQKSAKIRPHLLIHVPYTTMRTLVRTSAAAIAASRAGAEVTEATTARAEADPAGSADAVIAVNPDYQSLTGLEPATFSDGTPLAPSQLMHYLCDGAYTRAIFGSESQPLDVGREKRLHTTSQRLGIIARDRHCQYQGCTAPPLMCEFHHAVSWSKRGGTNVEDGILLCWTHHRVVHSHHLTIYRYLDRWEYRQPDGTVHSTVPRNMEVRLW